VPSSTTRVTPIQPNPNITEPSDGDCVDDGCGSLVAGSTGAGIDNGASTTTESEEATLDAVLLSAEVPEEELEEPLFVDLFSSEAEEVVGVSVSV
jgi:hypothetical protein